MKLSGWKAGVAAVLLLVANRNASAQSWPLPADAPKTDVGCDTPSCAASNQTGKKTVGYPETLKFVGRWLDSSSTAIRQYPFRTARSRMIRFVTLQNGQRRLYAIVGSALAAYNAESFFSRVTAREQLMPTTAINTGNVGAISGTPEVFLKWDRWFYAEGIGGWVTEAGDGYERLMNFDIDDRGYVYLAYDGFSWGIVHDDGGTGGGLMANVYQQYPVVSNQDLNSADIAVSLKVGSSYYVAISGREGKTVLYNVTGLAAGQKPQRLSRSNEGIVAWAKSADGNTLGIVDGGGNLLVYSTADYVAGKPPLKRIAPSSAQNPYACLATDGTRFFSGALDPSGNAVVVTLSPDTGYAYTDRSLGWPLYGTPTVEYSDGYFAVSGVDAAFRYATNVRIYRAANYEEVPVEGYLAKYYTSGGVATLGPQYAYPPSGMPSGIRVYRSSGPSAKTYLLLSMYSLGDVYELRAGGSISARVTAPETTRNQFSKTAASDGPFYGNELTLKSDVSSDVSMVNWSLGETPVPTVKTAAGGAEIKHQYGGLSAAQLPATFRVSAASASDSTIVATTDVTLKRPAAAVMIKDKPSLLFLQPNASAPAQIVVGDYWVDASDGAVESHVAEWAFSDLAAERHAPNVPVSVGGCTAGRTLTFTAQYGPYDAGTLAPKSTTIPYKVDGITYMVRPYAVSITGPTVGTGADDGRLIFTASPYLSSALASAGDTAVSYKWDITDSTGNTIIVPGTSTTATLSTIAPYKPLKSAFAGASDWRVKLSVNATGAVAAGCEGLRETSAFTATMTGPDPTVPQATGCGNVGAPCSIKVASANGRDTSGWQYEWSAVGPATVATSNAAEYKPAFSQPGKYTVSVTVRNAIGVDSKSADFTVGASVCNSAPNDLNTGIGFRGTAASTTCTGRGSTCTAGEVIQFGVSALGWAPSSCDKYEWDFGDGSAASTDAAPTHTYGSNGTYTVKLKLIGGLSTADISTSVTIGPPPPQNPTCGTMMPDVNVYIGYSGSQSSCTASSGNCATNEAIYFSANSLGYSFGCGAHSFQWSFGDGTQSSQQNPQKTYATAGTYTVTLSISGPTGSAQMSKSVTVGSGGGPSQCPVITPGYNVYVAYLGPQSGCTPTIGNCQAAEQIAFTASTYGYQFTCGTHSFLWTFGDGTTSTEQNPTKAYAQNGVYDVTLAITNSNGTVSIPKKVTVGSGVVCGTMKGTGAGQNVYVNYSGPSSQCNPLVSTQCTDQEAISFSAGSITGALGYSFSCATHTYEWDFGDGKTATGMTATHKYDFAGPYTVKLTIKSPTQTETTSRQISVSGTLRITPTSKRRSSRH